MRNHPYLTNRNGHYYFRIAVPVSLKPFWGKKELLCSLRTKDIAEARIRCLIVLGAAQGLFQESLAGQSVTIDRLKDCLSQLQIKTVPGRLQRSTGAIPDDSKEFSECDDLNPISKVFELYLAECGADRPKTTLTKRAMLKLWLEIMGDTPVKAIGKAQTREFKKTVMKLPSNMRKRFKGQSIKSVDLDAIPHNQRLSIKSVNINLSYMNAFMNWMIRNGHYEDQNPFSGLQLKDSERAENKKNAFSHDQLKAIFSTPIFTGCKDTTIHGRYEPGTTIIKDGFYWVPLIALYSGARMQEICQLYTSDLKQVGDIWIFDFNDDGKDKQLKTASSKRKTPVHPKLIELGLLEHQQEKLENKDTRLFPDLPMGSNGTYSAVFSKRFNHFLVRFGIKTDKTSFHSFRHTFIDAMRNTDVHREVREALVGHLDKRTAHDNYGSAIGIQRLYQGIIKLDYPYLIFEIDF